MTNNLVEQYRPIADYIMRHAKDKKHPSNLLDFDGIPLLKDSYSQELKTQTNNRLWEGILREANSVRLAIGCGSPISLAFAIAIFLTNNPTAVNATFPKDAEQLLNLDNPAPLLSDLALTPKTYHERLVNTIGGLIEDIGTDQRLYDMNYPQVVLDDFGINLGILLDLGCGVGDKTPLWHNLTGLRVIGIDRQYIPPYYRWGHHDKVNFINADLRRLPFGDDEIEVAVMDSVASHMTKATLTASLAEVVRVLKPDQGILFVGPQATPSSWSAFSKVFDGKQGSFTLEAYDR